MPANTNVPSVVAAVAAASSPSSSSNAMQEVSLSELTISYIVNTCSSSISIISSFTIIIMILSTPTRLSSPYRRIIFGMSLADILQSAAILTGPFALPANDEVQKFPWALGGRMSCDIDGYLMAIGSTMVPFYLLLLCTYYFCRLNLKMSNLRFWRKVERWAHIFIITYTLSWPSPLHGFSS